MAAGKNMRASVSLAAIAVVTLGYYALASDIRIADASPDSPVNFIGRWELLDPASKGEEREIEDSAMDPTSVDSTGVIVTGRAILVDKQGNKLDCKRVASAYALNGVLFVKPADGSCETGPQVGSVACEVHLTAKDEIEADCPPFPPTRYKRSFWP